MADERTIHVKLAMADALGCFLISWIAFMVAMIGFDQINFPNFTAVFTISNWVGIGLLIVAVVAFFNENTLGSAIFGVLGLFFIAFGQGLSGIPGDVFVGDTYPGTFAVGFVGLLLIVFGVVSLLQPVKLLPILLFVAGIGFFMVALWWQDQMGDTYEMMMGVFMILTSFLALYIGMAVTMLTIKGKPVLPLLIKA